MNSSGLLNNATKCVLTVSEVAKSDSTEILFCGLMIFVNIFDLLVFHLWREKWPYIFFHQVLAFTTLGRTLAVFIQVTVRMFTVVHWNSVAQIAVKVFASVSWICYCYGIVVTFLISVDRWLCTEFVVAYRNKMSRRKAVIASGSSFMLTVGLVVPSLVHKDEVVACDEPLTYTARNALWQQILYALASGLICGPFLIITQARILMIVLSIKHRLTRNRLRSVPAGEQPALSGRRSILVAVKASMASIVTVLLTVAAILPSMVVQIAMLAGMEIGPDIHHVVNLFTGIQHLQSLPIYLAFFPEFRSVAKRLLTRNPRRPSKLLSALEGSRSRSRITK